MIDFSKHPISILSHVEKLGPKLTLEFSQYHYEPQSLNDQRQYFHVPISEAPQWFSEKIQALGNSQDLAFHSRVFIDQGELHKTYLHLPMIDFKDRPDAQDLERVASALREFNIDKFMLFDSGRSLHLYGISLLTEEEWIRYLGRCLLLNLPGGREIVDIRWVGHRLMGGYGTLRWTKNNPHYRAMPTLIS